MPKYLVKVNYTKEGYEGLRKEGAVSRVRAVTAMIGAAGGTVESFNFAFGDVDAYLICDFPSNAVAAGVAMAVSGAGGARLSTTVLITPEEADEAIAAPVNYRAPGA